MGGRGWEEEPLKILHTLLLPCGIPELNLIEMQILGVFSGDTTEGG